MVATRRALLIFIALCLTVVAVWPFVLNWSGRLPGGTSGDSRQDGGGQGAHLCVIIRTYWAHGPRGGDATPPLPEMLRYFADSGQKRLEVLVLVQDSEPFYELHDIVAKYGDSRVRIFAQNEGPSYAAKRSDGSWNPEYHDLLYKLTDDAIQACSPDTQWVLVTNGDNQYDAQLIPRLQHVPLDVDIVALDFYSRYQRVTAAPCERFAAGPGVPPCKENQLRFCNVDLAAAIYRWPRFVQEGHAFSAVDGNGIGLNDGVLSGILKRAGWKVHHISDACLVSHSPNPQLCALEGGAWDDSVWAAFATSGGRCISREDAERKLQEDGSLEALQIELSHDGQSFGVKRGKPLFITCIRQRFEPPFVNVFYPEQCAALIDGGSDY